MMRRARWLAVGAVLGAVGYQRLHSATRSQASRVDQVSSVRQAATAVGLAASAAGRTAGHVAGAAGWLARLVRNSRAAQGRHRAEVGGFIGDVRAGMDDYLDRHQANIDRQYRRTGNTLITARTPDRAAIPGGSDGAPEHRPGAGGSRVSRAGAGTTSRPTTRRQD
jgi:hypothetical protein